MQQQKQEELFEEVEVVDDAEEEGKTPKKQPKLSEIPKAQPKVKKSLVTRIFQSILKPLKSVFQNLRTVLEKKNDRNNLQSLMQNLSKNRTKNSKQD